MEFTIRKLAEEDWEIFSTIRLRALLTDPSVFGSNYDTESKYTETDWRSLLNDGNTAVFAVFEGDEPVGMTGVALDRNDPSGRTALLWGSWLEPRLRNQGLSRLFYDARLAWANEQPGVERIVVSHRRSNVASKIANERFGFVETHSIEKVWSDGLTEKEHFYELVISR
jgi:RimJ/RimL family protein N-acetyltransferase